MTPLRWLTSLLLLLLLPLAAWAVPFEDPFYEERELVLERVLVRGYELVPPGRIQGILGFERGQTFNAAMLAEGVQRLEESDLFREVDAYARPGSEPGKVVLVVRVREKRLPYVDWFEISPGRESYVFNLVELETFTKDRAAHLWLEGRLGDDYGGLFARARLGTGQYPLHLEGDLSGSSYEFHQVDPRQDLFTSVNRVRGLAGLNLPAPGSSELLLRLGLEHDIVDDEPREISDDSDLGDLIEDPAAQPAPIRSEPDASWIVGRLEWLRDTRDRPFWTRSGSLVRLPLHLEYDPRNERALLRAELDARLHFPLPEGQSLALRGYGAWASEEAPFYKRYFLTRGFRLRGGQCDWVQTPFGGTRQWQTSIEYRRPVLSRRPDPFLTLVLFSEAGASWQGHAEHRPPEFDPRVPVVTAGWGLLFKVPTLGPLGLHFGFPVAGYEGGSGFRLSVTSGFAF